MAKLNIDWSEIADPKVTTGAKAVEVADLSTPEAMLKADLKQADKPILIYLTSASNDSKTNQDVVDSTTLKDERVSIAAKFFATVRGDGDEIGRDHPFAQHLDGNALPRFVVFAADGTKVGKLEGRVSPSKLYDLMKKAVAHDYVNGTKLDGMVKEYQKVLTAIDKLEGLKNALAQKEGSDDSPAAKKEIAKRKDALAKEEEELRAKEEKVLALERKTAA